MKHERVSFFLAKVQAIHDGRFRPTGQALKVSDDRVDLFLPRPPALCFFPQYRRFVLRLGGQFVTCFFRTYLKIA